MQTWVPELSQVADRWAHAPWQAPTEALTAAGVELGTDYPRPIVDHNEARLRALAAYQSIRQNDGSEAASAMRTFLFETSLWLPDPPHRVFLFFADAANLETITPSWLRFEVATPLPVAMASGTQIDYRLRYRGVPMKWRSEIVKWDPSSWFTNSQAAGPYRMGVHEHAFEERDGGTLASDRVKYAALGGTLVNVLLVRRDVGQIFKCWQERLTEVFGGRPEIVGRRS